MLIASGTGQAHLAGAAGTAEITSSSHCRRLNPVPGRADWAVSFQKPRQHAWRASSYRNGFVAIDTRGAAACRLALIKCLALTCAERPLT